MAFIVIVLFCFILAKQKVTALGKVCFCCICALNIHLSYN